MTDLTCIGLTTLDILARPIDALPAGETTNLIEEIALAPAGTAGGAAVIAARLGLDVSLATVIGEDVNGAVLRMLLARENVNADCVSMTSAMPTSTTVLAINAGGGRPNFHMLGASILTSFAADVMTRARGSRFLHFAGLGFPELSTPQAVEALASIRADGVFTTSDLIMPDPNVLALLEQTLPHTDLFMPSAAEVDVLLPGMGHAEALAHFVAVGAGACIIKRGAEGVLGLIDGTVTAIPARAIDVVDTTSCGDSFCAGTSAGLARGMMLGDAAAYGIATASLVAQGLGTTGLLENAAQVDALMETAA